MQEFDIGLNRRPELLSPAGSFEAGCAAFSYGADAVYLGLPHFSARADAENLTYEQLEKLVAFGRTFATPRKIYVTLNTLLFSKERSQLIDSLAVLNDIQVDGVIIQDLGLAAIMKRYFPSIPRHASTQLACVSSDGARALKALGFSRIVTGRELSLKEAAEIGRNAGIEIEVFVHGALCYSVSGLCQFSAMTTGRSGNRGRCAYCCRSAFTAEDSNVDATRKLHPFSMRDLATVDAGKDFRSLPLASLKIEGRMKNPLYVAAVTDLYRHVIDGSATAKQLAEKSDNLRTIFSRPWTSLYTQNLNSPAEEIIDSVCIGHRGTPIGEVLRVYRDSNSVRWMQFLTHRALEKHDGIQIDPPDGGRPMGFAVQQIRTRGMNGSALTVPAETMVELNVPDETPVIPPHSTVYCSASQAVRRSFPVEIPRDGRCRILKPIDVSLKLESSGLTISSGETTVKVAHDFDPARDATRSESAARKAFERMGDDGFSLRNFTFEDPDGVFAPPGILNDARRQLTMRLQDAIDDLRDARLDAIYSELTVAPEERDISSGERCHVKVPVDLDPVWLLPLPDSVIVTLERNTVMSQILPWLKAVPREKLRFALPLMTRDNTCSNLISLLGELIDRGIRNFEVPDLSAWQMLQNLSPYCDAFNLTADNTWYAMNPNAIAVQQACGIVSSVSGTEDTLENLLLNIPPKGMNREIPIAEYVPLFISTTEPQTNGATVLHPAANEKMKLNVIRRNDLFVTVAEQPMRVEIRDELKAAGYSDWRIDVSWAAYDVLNKMKNWQEVLERESAFEDRFYSTNN